MAQGVKTGAADRRKAAEDERRQDAQIAQLGAEADFGVEKEVRGSSRTGTLPPPTAKDIKQLRDILSVHLNKARGM